ncbi:MAG: DUF2157 domain-containing protein [Acidobacteriota bacterium]|nr:DUF2157 domain-containing protein [Acidobacteriota bacterium]
MSERRETLIRWAEAGHLDRRRLRRALELVGVLPSRSGWLRFLDHLMLWLGVAMVGSGVICFFAYNWSRMGRFSKLGLMELLVVAALVALWRLDLRTGAGKAALFGASLAVGALLALVGQLYQTGVANLELFVTWAILILPWVWIARSAGLWIFWLGLLHCAIGFHSLGMLDTLLALIGPNWKLWSVFVLDTAALACWEWFVHRGQRFSQARPTVRLTESQLQDRWPQRLIAVAGGAMITFLGSGGLFERKSWAETLLEPAPWIWLVWCLGFFYVYRRKLLDPFMLAGGVLSVIVIISTVLIRLWMDEFSEEPGPLFILALMIIGMAAAGAWWLRRLEDAPPSAEQDS